jgi:hypothetical protein
MVNWKTYEVGAILVPLALWSKNDDDMMKDLKNIYQGSVQCSALDFILLALSNELLEICK